MQAIFSDRAMTSLLVETKEKVTTETGGVFLGTFRNGIWYIVECIDPGPHSIFEPAYFEYDLEYINHLINKVSRIYEKQLDLIGLWHRHPGSLDTFSSTDNITNGKYAKLSKNGAISGLVNIDPEFRFTLYHVRAPLQYETIEWKVGNENIPSDILKLKGNDGLIDSLNKKTEKNNNRVKMNFLDKFSQKANNELIEDFGNIIHRYLKKRTLVNVKPIKIQRLEGEESIDKIVESTFTDLEYISQKGVSYEIKMDENGFLTVCGYDKTEQHPWALQFGKNGDDIVLGYNEIVYKYKTGLFQAACEEFFLMRGGRHVGKSSKTK